MPDTIGIGISKDTVDAHRLPARAHGQSGNGRSGLAALRRRIGKAPVRVVHEAAGRYRQTIRNWFWKI